MRRLAVLFQFLVLAAQPLPLRFRPTQILPQPLVVPTQLLDDLLRRLIGGIALRHATVMPNRRSKYKYELFDFSSHPLNRYAVMSGVNRRGGGCARSNYRRAEDLNHNYDPDVESLRCGRRLCDWYLNRTYTVFSRPATANEILEVLRTRPSRFRRRYIPRGGRLEIDSERHWKGLVSVRTSVRFNLRLTLGPVEPSKGRRA